MSFFRFTSLFRTHASHPQPFKSALFFRPRIMDTFFRPSHPFGHNVTQRNFSIRTSLWNASQRPPRPSQGSYNSSRRSSKPPEPQKYPEPVRKRASEGATRGFFHSFEANQRVVYGFIGLNCAIFAYYHYVRYQAESGAYKPLEQFVRNFTLNSNDLKEGRFWTVITSNYTHFGFIHILGNLISFHVLGSMLANTPIFTPLRLAGVIITSGVMGSLTHIYMRNKKEAETGRRDNNRALGFSGAVMGVGSLAACLYPREKLLIYGIIPVPLWLLIAGYFAYDGYYLDAENSSVGHAGHLGGLVTGLLFFARYRFFRS